MIYAYYREKMIFMTIIPPIDENGDNRLNLSECINLSIKKNYSDSRINIISISDDATDIRNTLKTCFGENVKIILDWYHICKKTREFLSMISKNKVSKLRDLKHLLHLFWTGEINNAIDYVKVLDSKNDLQKDRFLKYLEKHKSEIINYEKRKKSGKTIGSGRIEKAVDQAVGIRQKKKAMSWSKNGSKSLAFLNIFHLNKNNKNSKSKYAEI